MTDAETSSAPSYGYETLEVHDVGPVRFVILNRPAARNSLDLVLRRELAAAVREADVDTRCRAVLLTGAGPVFCAGGDIKTLNADPVASRARLELAGDVARAIVQSETPVVAAVNGGAWGAGLSIAAACDVVVVGRSARLVAAFGRFGLVGDTGAFQILQQRVGRARAKELLLLNASVSAEQAVAEHLATLMVEDGEVRRAAYGLARQLAGAGAGANAWTKRILREEAHDFDSLLAVEIEAQVDLLQGPCFGEGQRAFVEKREPHWWDDLDTAVLDGLLDVEPREAAR